MQWCWHGMKSVVTRTKQKTKALLKLVTNVRHPHSLIRRWWVSYDSSLLIKKRADNQQAATKTKKKRK